MGNLYMETSYSRAPSVCDSTITTVTNATAIHPHHALHAPRPLSLNLDQFSHQPITSTNFDVSSCYAELRKQYQLEVEQLIL